MWKHARHRAITIDGERRSAVCMAQSRLSILAACFVFSYLMVVLRLLDLAVVQGNIQNHNSADFFRAGLIRQVRFKQVCDGGHHLASQD